ncbi:hypothetical protein [Endozoicomonas sp. 2B-B]
MSEQPFDSDALSVGEGRQLRQALADFWQRCQQQNNCSEQLIKLKHQLTDERFHLVSQYLTINARWQRVLGDMALSDLKTLKEQVNKVRQEAFRVWTKDGFAFFADEFALYDYKLDAQSLKELPSDEFVDRYLSLREKWQSEDDVFGLTTKTAQYEQALSLMPEQYTASEREQVRTALAQHYLSREQEFVIIKRQQQLIEQQQNVQDYQAGLRELKAQLAMQRAGQDSELAGERWQSYYQKQVEDYRRRFFAQEESK